MDIKLSQGEIFNIKNSAGEIVLSVGSASTDTVQEKLVSGTNIKTVNGNSILGSGNLDTGNVFEAGTGANSAVQKGGNGTAFGANSVVEGISVTNAITRGITSSSTNASIISEWSASTPDTNKFSLAKGEASHAEGNNCLALGNHSHAEGNGTIASDNSSHAEGTGSRAEGKYSHAEGLETRASGQQSHTEGKQTGASASCSHAEGQSTIANRAASHAEGINTIAGTGSKPTVDSDTTAGKYSHAEGNGTFAGGNSSHAEGNGTEASGAYSHSEGLNTIASGPSAHAEGESNEATEDCSHAEGYNNKVYRGAGSSHVEGSGTEARNSREHAQGSYNVSHTLQNHGFNGSSEKTLHSVGIGTSDNTRKNAFEIMQNGDAYLYGVGGYDGTNATASTSNTLQQCLSKTSNLTEITWSALKSLRDSSGLTPGMQYRITDYNTTTVQADTQSAGHQFDIIVVADDNHTLNENARAIRHAGDTYFSGATLEAWELKYDIDNDTTKYAWADSGSTGRGVIYYMKDEWNNECPYDFKNIQFPRYKITACPKSPDLVGQYSINGANGITVDTTTTYWCYTFTWINANDGIEDLSIVGQTLPNDEEQYNGVFDNKIESFSSYALYPDNPSSFTFALSNNCFISTYEYEDGIFYGCYANRLGSNCINNTFGNYFQDNTFGNHCYYNTFGNYFYYNTFGNECYSNTFGNHYGDNTFGNNCYYNTFGNDCYYNTFGNGCIYNTFGNNCRHNTFGNNCGNNTFGNECYSNTFGESVKNFITGNATGATTSAQTKDYIRYLIVENGVENVNAYCTGTTSSSSYCQNIKIGLGVKGTSSGNRLQIDITSQIGAVDSVTYQTTNARVVNIP